MPAADLRDSQTHSLCYAIMEKAGAIGEQMELSINNLEGLRFKFCILFGNLLLCENYVANAEDGMECVNGTEMYIDRG